MDEHYLILILQIITLLILLYMITRTNENMCVQRDYGMITDVPASVYADANSALVHSSSIGQAPLGDPRFWQPNRSPITQGQYGLYQPTTLPLDETQPFDRSDLIDIAAQVPTYTEQPLPPQCKSLSS